MADLSISGRMTVKGLKKSFKKSYGLTLRVYKGNKYADEDATLSSLSDKKVQDLVQNPICRLVISKRNLRKLQA